MEKPRAPIVVVLGHVDHGKTSLLDAIRKTSVAAREAGGITQRIGASLITFTSEAGQNKTICFIDTPGHALFSAMRARGAKYADIALLIVAGDDGVAPQTKEALQIIREENIPFIVVITKTDLPTALPESVLQQLEKEGVYFEKRGGDIPYVEVSSKTGHGIKDLLDLISLVSEVSEVKADSDGELSATVLETSKDKKGLLVSVVVINGRLKIGQTVFAGEIEAKIKGLFNDLGEAVKEINPGEPGQILGFSVLAPTGATIKSKPYDLKDSLSKSNGEKESKVKVYIKAKTSGGLEALVNNLPKGVYVTGSSVGDLNENDVFLAKAANASIFIFEAKTPSSVSKLADTEGVAIEKFDIIYALIERLTEIITSGETKILGKAQIVASFPFDGKKVAGCKVIDGVIKKQDRLELQRGEATMGRVRVITIRKQKDEVQQVRQGEECGILFEPQLDFKLQDMLLSVSK